jgi:hypothetical protein
MPTPITRLPQGYTEIASLDLTRDYRLLVRMQLWGLLGLLFSMVFFAWAMARLRPGLWQAFGIQTAGPEGGFSVTLTAPVLFGMLFSVVLMIVLHEAVHGLFFWLFTGRRPTFGFKIYYAYAASPAGTYLRRGQYGWVGLSPLVLLSALGLVLTPLVPAWGLPLLYFFLVGNASGSIGDVFVIAWLQRLPPETLVQDLGDAMLAYAPAPAGHPSLP